MALWCIDPDKKGLFLCEGFMKILGKRLISSPKGISLLEVLVASCIATIAIAGILYIYHIQHKGMLVQSGIAEMRMNGQYTLQESQYYLTQAGAGLPSHSHAIFPDVNGLGFKMNPTQTKIRAQKFSSGNSFSQTTFRIPAHSDSLFKFYVWAEGITQDTAIISIQITSTDTLLVVGINAANFPNAPAYVNLYPVARQILKTDGQGHFRIHLIPGLRNDLQPDTLNLAEGIDSLNFRFISSAQCTTSIFPDDLDTLQRILIQISARTLLTDGKYSGDGYHRQHLQAAINFRRQL